MDLKTFIKSLPDEAARGQFAERCGTKIGHLRNVMYGLRPCSAELAASIEVVSNGEVTRQELCPEKWRRIWPELAAKAA